MINILKAPLEGQDLRVAVVVARFNEPLCNGLRDACVGELRRLGVADDDILVVSVPGALEIPVALQSLAESDGWDALIALGAVVRGETYHFEIVSNEMAAGITRVQLDYNIPVANGVLTVENDAQGEARVKQKGIDCAQAAVEMGNLLIVLSPMDEEDEGGSGEPAAEESPRGKRLN